MSKLTIICHEWRPLKRNTLRGFARLEVNEMKLVISDISVHERDGKRWAALPAKPWVRDGALVIEGGKIQYSPVLEFTDKATRDAFSARVVEAVLAHTPDAFEQKELTP